MIELIVKKILRAKLFDFWKNSIVDKKYEILVLSQFTLFGKLKGTKMDFHLAEEHFRAKEFFDKTIQKFIQLYGKEYIKNGIFGEQLEIMLINDGPVTIIFDTNAV